MIFTEEFIPYQMPFVIIMCLAFYVLFYYAITDKYIEKPALKDLFLLFIIHFGQIMSIIYLHKENKIMLAYAVIIVPAFLYGIYSKFENKKKALENYKIYLANEKLKALASQGQDPGIIQNFHYKTPNHIPPQQINQQPPNTKEIYLPQQEQQHVQQIQQSLQITPPPSQFKKFEEQPLAMDNSFYNYDLNKQNVDYSNIQNNNMPVGGFDSSLNGDFQGFGNDSSYQGFGTF